MLTENAQRVRLGGEDTGGEGVKKRVARVGSFASRGRPMLVDGLASLDISIAFLILGTQNNRVSCQPNPVSSGTLGPEQTSRQLEHESCLACLSIERRPFSLPSFGLYSPLDSQARHSIENVEG